MTDRELGAADRRISAIALSAALDLPAPTAEQVAVIEAPMDPVLVVAGAGAGKTETMAARVVWLVANRLVSPDQVIGLTFTRKAAAELAVRIRRRLAMLASSAAMTHWDPDGSLRLLLRSADPEVSTYHAYAGRLIADYGLLLPVEPSSTLLSETELWQLAFGVVAAWDEDLEVTKTPSGVTEAVLSLYSEAAEHLVDIDDIAAAGQTLHDLVDTLPRARGQRAEPSGELRKLQHVIVERRRLLPLVSRLARTMREQNVLDFGSQMSLAARLVRDHPEVAAGERAGIRAVLLDEYQDTGHSQRVLLSTLFGGVPRPDAPAVAVTAVGDPIQSIYGWRGASAANLPRFADDFRCADGTPAARMELLTSWRNPRTALELANTASEELRAVGVPVSVLRARSDAPVGTVELGLFDTIDAERHWCAEQISDEYRAAEQAGQTPPTVAILVRRNEDSAPLAAELEARGIPVEVVGIGGLLHVPEVVDVVAMLRLMVDPMAGTAAMRLLTGARWQLGAADLDALWRRARALAVVEFDAVSGTVTTPEALDAALDAAVPSEVADVAGLGDAIADPGDENRYSTEGLRRIKEFASQLDGLRRRVGQPLTELVADVEEVLGVGIEAQIRARRMRGDTTGREHLDAFAEYVAEYAERSAPSLPGLLAFLESAATIEKGLTPGKVEIAEARVQILTVHAAKGLEWDMVVLPHVSTNIFPGGKSDSTWLGSAAELPAELRGDLADVDGEGFPRFDPTGAGDRKELSALVDEHKEALRRRKLEEDRRLLYVALTRTKRALLVSAHHWAAGGVRPKGPSMFMTELHAIVEDMLADPGTDPELAAGLTVAHWEPTPVDDAANPMSERVISAIWPPDPLGTRRAQVRAGADRVLEVMRKRGQPSLFEVSESSSPHESDEVAQWRAEVDALLAERAGEHSIDLEVALPQHLSVSDLVELDKDEGAFARRLRRPMPFKPNPLARRGTAFHAWVERQFGATRLLDMDELPGAADEGADVDGDLAVLREAFLASAWASRSPIEVEVPFETVIGSTVIRGRMDAVFAEPDGGAIVVDWKTGAQPAAAHHHSVTVQLAAYRIAWAELSGLPLEKVRAAFHYVRDGATVEPSPLPGRDQLARLLDIATGGDASRDV
ncbi:ATP-dependent DNA helicase [Williamsia sp. CHRR-6]|uniref:ATP-dependent DNA helicase n=1 Tax=Williamsia sp. CHRR-6 TaxID=2835871 RepID=UPI001BDB254B|nr:UvrD-helicase domain-containing protein [Williamsia sp. CHRR-6]MBT0565637.1 ATP-dependent helicase [Williamsia sp. CHRR-6]